MANRYGVPAFPRKRGMRPIHWVLIIAAIILFAVAFLRSAS